MHFVTLILTQRSNPRTRKCFHMFVYDILCVKPYILTALQYVCLHMVYVKLCGLTALQCVCLHMICVKMCVCDSIPMCVLCGVLPYGTSSIAQLAPRRHILLCGKPAQTTSLNVLTVLRIAHLNEESDRFAHVSKGTVE